MFQGGKDVLLCWCVDVLVLWCVGVLVCAEELKSGEVEEWKSGGGRLASGTSTRTTCGEVGGLLTIPFILLFVQ